LNNRQRVSAILNYEPYDRMPVVHFGFWDETLWKWAREGHISDDEARSWGDGNASDKSIGAKLGFDLNYYSAASFATNLRPGFESRVVRENPDGSREVLNSEGMIVLQKEGAGSIPMEIDHLLKSRKEWEEEYLPKMQFAEDRAFVSPELKAYVEDPAREEWFGIHCGSLYGSIRNWLGVEGSAYLQADDPELFKEIVDTMGDLCYLCVETALKQTSAFDFAHFWEDICFKSGPLISPRVFDELVGPHYKRITDLTSSYGINICSLDCDGKIDALVPIWLANGVNTMFPIEVGTWNASIAPWREHYGRELRGVGGTNKVVFARDRAAVDAEIERLKPLVDLGGFIPCPDHRIPPDAEWDNVRYYCDRMREAFG